MGLLLATPRPLARRLVRPSGPSPLAGRTVLVTGSSSGIGEGAALAVARRGAPVLLLARRTHELERVQRVITAEGGRAFLYPCDLTDGVAVDAAAKQMLTDH